MTRKANVPVAPAFDQDSIRLFIGLIALLLPVAVVIAAWGVPESISGSYHEPGDFPFLPYFPQPRDIFVGCLFVIGAFLMSYQGWERQQIGGFWLWLARYLPVARKWGATWRRRQEDFISSLGGISAWIVALFPTEKADPAAACRAPLAGFDLTTPADPIAAGVSTIHMIFAAILFLTTVYFCLVAFRARVVGKIQRRGTRAWLQDALQWRLTIYYVSGYGILLVILFLGGFALFNKINSGQDFACLIRKQTYWAEVVMLFFFAAAWITASKPSFLKDASEKSSGTTAE